ncbi:MAG: riboflavin biosynthesis protein RibF [Phycisphaerales bacterium]|nr:riboflavin biosynthesis protein RibF [Phycisphaerales bacterium]MDP6310707.1 riboflavin biosynthesis protein RibF [Phycisphaerales bacterium]MDP7087941.1 riboflavin biosynthesis protein RibF [Phycisphaerales bacterium]MDP7189451.1 riboflavin biosynthesis protein RibF [Phycisphaerales bacterium]MDP7519091.1 riboflavin biosynthesis protein RibF [Phycisphaerales bacterium]
MANTALTIGNFDGVHLGHAALILAARQRAGLAGRVLAMTFDPPPAVVLTPGAPRRTLTTLPRRIELLESLGVDEVIVQTIDRDWLEQSAEDFIRGSVLPRGASVIVEGPDFQFGKGRAGNIETLVAAGKSHGFEVECVPTLRASLSNLEQVPVRSSQIRWLLMRGRVADAARLLGRPWRMEGTVNHGDRRGREIGYPTANLSGENLLLPADGVYAGTAICGDGTFPAAVSIGSKPTFDGSLRVFETHLIGWDGPQDQYGWYLKVDLHRWLRDQVAFESPEMLRKQIARDVEAAASIEIA